MNKTILIIAAALLIGLSACSEKPKQTIVTETMVNDTLPQGKIFFELLKKQRHKADSIFIIDKDIKKYRMYQESINYLLHEGDRHIVRNKVITTTYK